MNRQKALVKNTIILAVGTFFPKFAIFITLPILTAYMTQAEYGTYDLVITLVALLLPAATLQIQSAAFRFLIDTQKDEVEKKSIVSNIYGFIIPVSVVVLMILFLLLRSQPAEIRLGICAYFLFDIIANANRQIVRGLSKNQDYTISACISSAGQILLIIILVLGLKTGLLGGVIALACAEFLSAVFLFFKSGIYRYLDMNAISRVKLKSLLSYSWPMVPNSLSQWVMNVSDRMIITLFMGVAANAIYAVAYKIPSILNFAQMTFNMAWQENASIVSKDEDAAAYYSAMFEVLFNIVAGFLAVLIGITPILFKILVRGNYKAAYNQIPILYMGMLFFALSSFWGGIFVAYKKTKIVGTTTVCAAAINLAIDLLTIRRIGIYAASISTLASYIVLCIFRIIGVQKLIKLHYNVRHIAAVLCVLILLCISCAQQRFILDVINFAAGTAAACFLNSGIIKILFRKVLNVTSSPTQ
ncbi:oligosaccharide flippase family protein [Clostridium sp. AM58-1XD]|uniref:lipopolysaccharide biosynthesis protein n=1 Tax=Clostridium sp. AM58-1XD TaxID=2292307 RepID=UPI000E53353D|nr:oligosaccharide flippase family protein [Clostridium sp. AM58-1XD]RGY96750.1 hypothetical protein DXA13_16500 [Clostridium sp. AM58-1XD]